MRRLAPATIDDIRHPGPAASMRRPFIPCHASEITVSLPSGAHLLEALGVWADQNGYASAVLDLSGLTLKTFDYVMPDRAVDDRHVAWYSDTHTCKAAKLSEAVAILGKRDGAWFAHIHAYWQENGVERLGHLLPDTIEIASPEPITGFGLTGASFESEPDPETEFTLYRVKATPQLPPCPEPNAVIATLAPFEDLGAGVEALASTIGAGAKEVLGLGSLAGAAFQDGSQMTGLISEILVCPGATFHSDQPLTLPIRSVDLHGTLFHGDLVTGHGPTLVTCELLIVRSNTR